VATVATRESEDPDHRSGHTKRIAKLGLRAKNNRNAQARSKARFATERGMFGSTMAVSQVTDWLS